MGITQDETMDFRDNRFPKIRLDFRRHKSPDDIIIGFTNRNKGDKLSFSKETVDTNFRKENQDQKKTAEEK